MFFLLQHIHTFEPVMKQLRLFILLSGIALFFCCSEERPPSIVETSNKAVTKLAQKDMMLMLTDRPPQLETPIHIFREDITPNRSFFVRWHLSDLLTEINIDTFKLRVNGEVKKPLALSLNELKADFASYEITALAICAGNGRSCFNPAVPGSQWAKGGMGNAVWKGVKLKDILERAGIMNTAVDIAFNGLDKNPLTGVPDYIKSLPTSYVLNSDAMIAYEMNGEELPMLNGYPLRLIVPGWYATYWIKSLCNIEVLPHKYEGFWMKSAYKIVDNPARNENPDSLSPTTVPITEIALNSIFVDPAEGEVLQAGEKYHVEGLAYDAGYGIKKVEFSFDNGQSWLLAQLGPDHGKYSWRRWHYQWTPETEGEYFLKVRAFNNKGDKQSENQWNRSGYARNVIEQIRVNVKQ